MRKLTVRTSGGHLATFTELPNDVWSYEFEEREITDIFLLFFLQRENNRGFTFRNYSLLPNYFEVFISNGDIISDSKQLLPGK